MSWKWQAGWPTGENMSNEFVTNRTFIPVNYIVTTLDRLHTWMPSYTDWAKFISEDASSEVWYSFYHSVCIWKSILTGRGRCIHLYFDFCVLNRVIGHPITMNTLSYAINFWSKGTIKALFLRHEGYLGAVGAFMKHRSSRRNSRSFTLTEQLAQKLADPDTADLEVTLAQDTLDVVADEESD